MSINKFQKCNPDHQNELQYCCLKSNKVFCQSCWFRECHFYRCFSSKCGHFQKLAHLVIDRTLQMKVMYSTSEMASSSQKYQSNYTSFFKAKETITQRIKSDVENKLPLFIWSALVQMLTSKNPKFSGLIYQQSTCSQMLKIIKKKQNNKLQCLEQVIKSFQKINHQYTGLQNKIKEKAFEGKFDKQIQNIVDFLNREGSVLIGSLSLSIKKHMEAQVAKILQKFDPSIKFDGIKFNSKRNFESLQSYNIQSLSASIFPQWRNNDGHAYHGIKLDIQKLEESPEMLLQISKSILKQQIYRIHTNLKQLKSAYPYKYAYIICTSLQPDPDYQTSLLNLERLNIKLYQKKSEYCFLNSINLIIMGPQLITVEFKNFPKKMTEINIFGFTQSRQKQCNQIIETHIGASKDKSDVIKIIKHPFQQKLTLVEKVYVQFQLAYEHLFIDKQKRAVFEGERLALGRGIKLFQDVVQRWKQKAIIQFNIQKQIEEFHSLFI